MVLAASACESARILLNSKSSLFPDGVANGSGLVGKYLMDTVGAGVSGQIPALENLPRHAEEGASALHMYMPWWLYSEQLGGQLKEIIVNDLVDGTFYAKLIVEQDGQDIEVDSRPSDAIALGVAEDVPIYVDDDVLDPTEADASTDFDLEPDDDDLDVE